MRENLSQQTAQRLYARIVAEKRLRPGDKLPNEVELSAQLGVSRATLREAIRDLTVQGVLEVRRGWWLMCLVMVIYYVIVIYLIPGYVGFEQDSTILKPAVSLLMVGFYSVLMFLFSSVRKEAETRHSAQLSALQLSALQSRMEAVKAAENVIRTERHDLRHRLQAVRELVSRGDKETAL